jgi:hypothetical protein
MSQKNTYDTVASISRYTFWLTKCLSETYPEHMDADFIQTQITNVQAQIVNINAVITKITANPRQNYSINDGQSSESVTTLSMTQALNVRERLMSELVYWNAMLNGTGSPTYAAPGF